MDEVTGVLVIDESTWWITMALISPYDVNMNYSMQVDLGKRADGLELYIQVQAGGARKV